MKVVLDTNALMAPFEYRINIDMEIQRNLGHPDIYVPSCVLGELRKLSSRRWEARAALQLAQKYREVDVQSPGDSGVIEAAKKLNAHVITNDQELIKKLKKEKIPVLYVSQNHLVMLND